MTRRLLTLLNDQRGATAIEYGLIASLIVIAMISTLNGVAGTTTNMWEEFSNAVVNAAQ